MRGAIKKIIVLGILGGMVGCQNGKVALPPNSVIVQKKLEAKMHAKEKYFLGHVQVLVAEGQLNDVILDFSSKKGIELYVLDKIVGRPIYLLEIQSEAPVPEVVKLLKEDRRVLMASPHYQVSLNTAEKEESTFHTNDPLLPTQWGLNNEGQEAPWALAGRKGADIGMGGVETAGSYDVVVGVIDTGIDYFHEDLAVTEMIDGVRVVMPGSNIWMNPGEISGNGINDDNNGEGNVLFVDDVYGYNFVARTGDPRDDHGHGTHVAGVIGALRNNFIGISGMNEKVSLMALKFLDSSGSGSDFDAQAAIYYTIDLKKRFPEKKFILSNSWGSSGRDSKDGDEDDFLLMAFREAAGNDILSVAAAGNDETSNRFSPHYPANYSNKISHFITVAATNNLDHIASFSSFGFDNVQVAAPGVLIQSTVPAYTMGVSYDAWSGTSMATPHVSGLAALLWAANPQMTGEEVKQRIINTVDILPQLKGLVSTSGRINVARALKGEENPQSLEIVREIPQVVESHRPQGSYQSDIVTTLESPQAKEISVCFSRVDLQPDEDWIEIMGADYQVRETISGHFRNKNWKGEERELCSAPIPGGMVHIRLYNQGRSQGLQGFETTSIKVVE